MHQEILTDSQKELLPSLSIFSKDFGLVGGPLSRFILATVNQSILICFLISPLKIPRLET